MPVTPAWVEEPTRINIFIHDGKQEYKLVNLAHIFQMNVNNKLSRLFQLPDADYLVISGSLPQGIESRFYAEIMHICQQKISA